MKKMKLKTLRRILVTFLVAIWIASSIWAFWHSGDHIYRAIAAMFGFGVALLLLYLCIDEAFFFKMSWREMKEEAWKEIKDSFKNKVGEYQKVYYLFPKENSNKEFDELAYMAKYKGYIFLAKILDDKNIYLSCVDDKGNEIEHKEISNPFFFMTCFSFTTT